MTGLPRPDQLLSPERILSAQERRFSVMSAAADFKTSVTI